MEKYAICTIIKNEHRYICEWIDYNISIGFNAIHLYEDNGSKSHKDLLSKYPNVFIHQWSECPKIDYSDGDYKQVAMMQHFIDVYKKDYDWVAFIDVDEFIRFEEGYNLHKLCNEFNNYDAIYLLWRIIGASGHITRPIGRIQDTYFNCDSEYNKKTRFKSICNLHKRCIINNVHKIKYGVFTNGANANNRICRKKSWIDHYFTKSYEDWVDRFFEKGDVANENRKFNEFFLYNKDMQNARNLYLDKLYFVFDVGANNGDDSEKYINLGCKVVAVECNETLVQNLKNRFNGDKRFVLENICISDSDGTEDFYISTKDVWSSCNRNIAERLEESQCVKVNSTTLQKLFDKYGVPLYCKIDIEGNDIKALSSIKTPPKYISCESECIYERRAEPDYDVLNKMHQLGYNKFILVNQSDNKTSDGEIMTILPWNYHGKWYTYDEMVIIMKEEYKKTIFKNAWGFWRDLYATF